MATFYKPSTTDPTLTDAQGNPINYTQYKSLGGLGTEGGGGWTDVTQGAAPKYAPLPPLTGNDTGAQDPIDIFNIKLMELMAKAQGANKGNTALTNRSNYLQNLQSTQSSALVTDPSTNNLTPSDLANSMQFESQLYNPEVKALNDRMQLNNEAVTRFSNTLDVAAKMGEQYAKMIKPSEQTVEAIRMQLRSGVLPSEDVLTKVQGQLTQEDWDAYVQAKSGGGSAPSSVQEYEYAKGQGYTGTYQQWVDRPSQYKGTGSDTSVSDEKALYDLRVKQAPSQVAVLAKQGKSWGEIAEYFQSLGIDPGLPEIDDALHRAFQSQTDYEAWKLAQKRTQ